jgi:hypothetical protein
MPAFMLILAILGQPERAVADCDTYQKCSDQGAAVAEVYKQQLGTPAHFSYRVIKILIIPDEGQPT